ncbi:MAG: NADH-quinone oxidoreductase subunit I [Acidimicrobiia bacterium]
MARSRIGHFYIEDTCIGCGACEHACPGKVDAIYKVETDFMGRFAIVLEECIDCGFCVPMCPVDCIRDARTVGLDAETESGWKRIRDLQAWAGARDASGGFAAPPGAPTPGSSGAWGPNPTPGRRA